MTRYEALAEYVRNFATTVETTLADDETGEMWTVALREVANEIVSLGQQHAGAVELWRAWRALADDEDADLEALGHAWQEFAAAMDSLAGGQ